MEPMDLKLEESFVTELFGFIANLPLDTLSADRAERVRPGKSSAADVMDKLIRSATLNTTVVDATALFGQWCAFTDVPTGPMVLRA